MELSATLVTIDFVLHMPTNYCKISHRKITGNLIKLCYRNLLTLKVILLSRQTLVECPVQHTVSQYQAWVNWKGCGNKGVLGFCVGMSGSLALVCVAPASELAVIQ